MKNFITIIVTTMAIFSQQSIAQVTQVELFSGFHKSSFSYVSIKPLNEKGTLSLSTLAFFQKHHLKDDVIFDEIGVRATAYWNFSKTFSVGPSFYYNSKAGFTERLSFLVSKRTKKLVLVAIPSFVYSEKTSSINGELFAKIQFMQPLKNEWYFIAYGQLLTSWTKFSTHARGYQQLRIGLSHKNNQFGLAADFDQYGQRPITQNSFGIFARKVIFDK